MIDESKHQLNELQSKIESAYVEVKYELHFNNYKCFMN